MSAPTFPPPLAIGVLDAGVDYYYVIPTAGEVEWQDAIGDNPASVGGLQVTQPGGTPRTAGVWLLNFNASDDTEPFSDVDRVISFDAIAATAGTADTTTQELSFTVRKFTAFASKYVKIASGTDVVGTYSDGARTALTAHGLALGDRVWFEHDAGSPAGARIGTVTEIVSANTFKCSNSGIIFANPSADWTLSHKQAGRQQGDIPAEGDVGEYSPPEAEATRGEAFSYEIITDDAGVIRAANAPNGIGLEPLSATLTGTPVEYGFFPIVLRAGAMQRYTGLHVEPGTYDSLITSSSTATAIVGRFFQYQATITLPDPTWLLDNAPYGLGINSGLISGTFATPGVYELLIHAVSGVHHVTKTLTVTVSPDRPVIRTEDYPQSGNEFASRTWTLPADRVVRIQLLASGAPESWTIDEAPPGLSFDTVRGLLTGRALADGFFPFTVTATNSVGTSDPVTFALNVTPVANPVDSAAFLPWLHADPTLIDLQVDIRTRRVRSFYMEAGNGIHVSARNDLRFAVVLTDQGELITELNSLRLGIRPTNDFDAGYLLEADSVEPVEMEGGTYFLLEILADDPELQARFDALNLPVGANASSRELACMAGLKWETTNAIARSSRPFNLVIEQDTVV